MLIVLVAAALAAVPVRFGVATGASTYGMAARGELQVEPVLGERWVLGGRLWGGFDGMLTPAYRRAGGLEAIGGLWVRPWLFEAGIGGGSSYVDLTQLCGEAALCPAGAGPIATASLAVGLAIPSRAFAVLTRAEIASDAAIGFTLVVQAGPVVGAR